MADPARINSPSRETSGADDVVFQEAIEALREGNKAKARDLLTGLIKNDQNNATYWVWMSAVMDTAKERVYCLQTAYKLDPENASAKRGLILHGALPADDSIQPFPLNHPRAWEEKLLLAHEKPRPKGWAAVRASPVFRLGFFIVIGAAIIGGVVFGFIIPAARRQAARPPTFTPGPSPTYTLTPTALNATGQPVAIGTSAPLSELLPGGVAYMPTPLYVQVQRSPVTNDYIIQFNNAYLTGKWDDAIRALQEILKLEPNTAYAHYYIGEAYRFKGDGSNAVAAYQSSVGVDPNFGAGYVGIARAHLMLDPNANVISFLDEAIRLDPNFGEAYLERAIVRIREDDIPGALGDLRDADSRMPNSPLVFFNLAQARLKEGDIDQALTSAQRANQLDVTNLATYILLAQLYAEKGNDEEAGKALEVYLRYKADDASAHLLLANIHFDNSNYQEAINSANRVILLDRNRREAYLIRFLSLVELGNVDLAMQDVDRISAFYPDSFEANIAIIRLSLLDKRNGDAMLAVEYTTGLAETDEQKALVYYWGGIVHEAREEPDKAAEYWELLLDLPASAMSPERRAEAREHLANLSTPTATVTPSRTPRRTPTLKPGTPTRTSTPTKTKTPTPTRTPTRTPTPTP